MIIGSELNDSTSSYETLYEEIIEKGGFNGKILNTRLCWRLQLYKLSFKYLISLALQSGKLKSIISLPNHGDNDWNQLD